MAVGAIGGVLILYGVPSLDLIKVDDPVGAIIVHGMGGLWGTLAVGFFSYQSGLLHGASFDQLYIQLVGASAIALCSAAMVTVVFWLISNTFGLRISQSSEERGLDIEEFGVESYNDSQIFSH